MNNLLINSAEKGKLDLVKISIKKGADINAQYDKALMQGSFRGNLELVEYLLENGAHINARNGEALKLAIYWRNFELFKYLIKKGANIHDDQVLKWASLRGNLEISVHLFKRIIIH